ncbi:MAG: flagellar hook assembly protein FlgD [Gammaproteobacteria bacterium]|nr:flagellar hook assembly protein FlgD [Gammaproteobacteria bacterium]MBI5615806.1 flagellar hook assembly protein FlgD [Gammaproteobacteria bacterium]
MTNSVNNNSNLPATLAALGITNKQAASAAGTDQNSVNQNTFLELMVAQLKNQDPTQPMQSGEFLTQIAQFSSVQSLNQLQSAFTTLASSLQSSQALQASTLVGRHVLIANEHIVTDGTAQPVTMDMPAGTSQARLSIYDGAGQLVRQIAVGPQEQGLQTIAWDGKNAQGTAVAAGQYRIKGEALVNGTVQALATYVKAPVESVTLPGNGQTLTLNLTGYGSTQLDAVKQVL